jgi:hypothetical protein
VSFNALSGRYPVDIERTGDSFRSVQRLHAEHTEGMHTTMGRYFDWLTTVFKGAVGVSGGTDSEAVVLTLFGVPAIRLKHLSTTDTEISYTVEGGALALKGGRFAFIRQADAGALAVLEGFRPRLPGWLYMRTHGLAHARIMQRFSRFLERGA